MRVKYRPIRPIKNQYERKWRAGVMVGQRADRGRIGVRRRSRVPLTVLATLLLVLSEFGLLAWVYHRAAPAREERVIGAMLLGETSATHTGVQSQTTAADALGAADQLHHRGVSTSELVPVRAAATRLAAAEEDQAALSDLQSASRGLYDRLLGRVRSYDRQAMVLYLVLLIGVSLGWSVWFRRLVARHRGLQQQITATESLAVGERRLAALVRNSADVLVVFDVESTVSFASPSSAGVLGMSADQLTDRRWSDFVHPDDRARFVRQLTARGPLNEESLSFRLVLPGDRVMHVEGSLTNLLGDPAVGGLLLTVRDVTERRQLEERLTHQAFHDSLTGLANRRLFTDRLAHALTRRPSQAHPLVVLFFDLDDFKQVNDSLGHGTGDKLLAAVGNRLSAVVRNADTAARLGGDEFAILLEHSDVEQAHTMAERILESLAVPVEVDGRLHSLAASVGIAVANPGIHTAEETLRNADVAMYLAKDRGKSSIAVYESALHEEALQKLELRSDLRRALRADEFVLHYQPAVDLRTREIVGFEALVRWQHPTRGLLAPGAFIDAAEESGLIVPLGSWVLAEACRAAAAMQDGLCRPTMSVNVSARQLTGGAFVEEVVQLLDRSGLGADRLCLEITESALLSDLDGIVPHLAALRSLGVRIAIDDFGTGYSSLSYLANLPLDVLKVDKSFVDRVLVDEQNALLTEAILAMGRTMNLTTIAEGVEDSGQERWLVDAECRYGQGYLWSKPVPFEQAVRLLRTASESAQPPRLMPPVAAGAPAGGRPTEMSLRA